MRARLVLVIGPLVAVVARNGDVSNSGERVSPQVQRELPTFQYLLSEDVCPEQLGMPPRQEERTRRRGERQLRALLRAYRQDPNARVRTTYGAVDEEPRIRHEEMTVEELLDTHLLTAEELASDAEEDACFARLADTLRDAKAAK